MVIIIKEKRKSKFWNSITNQTIDVSLLIDFSTGNTFEEISKWLGNLFVKDKYNGKVLSYAEAFICNGMLKYAEVTKDHELMPPLKAEFNFFFTTDKNSYSL